MNRRLRWAVVAGAAALVVAQLVPVKRENPPSETEVPAPPEVKAVLQRSCYNCHSNATVWPWYSRVAPVSWLVGHDVNEGRELLNYSTWNRLSASQQAEAFAKTWEEVEEGEMPPWYYTIWHRDARLDERDVELIRGWTHPAAGAVP